MEERKDASSKKRVAGMEISQDNPGLDDEDDGPEPDMGTFKRASEEVMASRRIVKVRHQQPQASPSNPFANISFSTPTKGQEKINSPAEKDQSVAEKSIPKEQDNDDSKDNKDLEDNMTKNGDKVDTKNATESKNVELTCNIDEPVSVENEEEEMAVLSKDNEKTDFQRCQTRDEVSLSAGCHKGKDEAEAAADKGVGEETKEVDKDACTGGENQVTTEPTPGFSSFQQLSSRRNAFTGLAGTGFSSSTFSFGSKDGPAFGFGAGSVFGKQDEKLSGPSLDIGSTANGNSSVQLFGSDASDTTRTRVSSTPAMKEVAVETGEENEKVVFSADAILFEYLDGGWKERGKGEIRVNVSVSGDERARLVMRARGNYRLILNSSIYPDMSLKNMDKRGITFACVNSVGEGKGTFDTFALKFKESLLMEKFRGTVTAYTEKKGNTILKTPENSPKASNY